MSIKVVGTCSLCGGMVTVPTAWLCIYPPTPTCQSCGAIKKNPHGPIIDMEKSPMFDTTKKDIDSYGDPPQSKFDAERYYNG